MTTQTHTICRINPTGLQQILRALEEYAREPRGGWTTDHIHAWACEAERSHDNGGGCEIEIDDFQSRSGSAVIVVIGSDGYDVTEWME